MSEELIITPKTRVLQLLRAYPQLEEKLIQFVPAFDKLKNPLLRNTVAAITTLQQAAAIGNVKVEDLVNFLRREVGQDQLEIGNTDQFNVTRPEWFNPEKVAYELDARPMLAAGEHPVNHVMADLKQMDQGFIYKLIAPFLPAPLIDKASSLGCQHWVNKSQEDLYLVYFFKP